MNEPIDWKFEDAISDSDRKLMIKMRIVIKLCNLPARK